MPTYVVPNYQLANINPGQVFQNEGKLYMLIHHFPLYTEIARYYWFDKLLSSAGDRIRKTFRRIKNSLKKGESLDSPGTIAGTTNSPAQIKSNEPKP